MNHKTMDFNDQNIELVRTKITKGKISFLSPLIQKTVAEEKNKETTTPEFESDYITDIARTIVFMDRFKAKTPNPILFELATEIAFVSFRYQKDNNFGYTDFKNFFNQDEKHPFEKIKGYINNNLLLYKDEDGKRLDNKKYILIRKKYSKEYSPFLNQTLSHEMLHQFTDLGFITGKKDMKKATRTLNEMCTEYNSFLIVKNYLDSNTCENTVTFTLLDKNGNKTNKEMSLTTELAHYKPQTVFFPAIKHIIPEINNLYFDRTMDLSNLPADKQKYMPLLEEFAINAELLCAGKNASYSNNICYEDNFHKIINSFATLAEKYIREDINIDKDTDLDEFTNYSKAKSLRQFFDTFDNISFSIYKVSFDKDKNKICEDKTPAYGEILKKQVLLSIYKDEQKVNEALNVMENIKSNTSSTETKASEAAPQKENVVSKEVSDISEKDTIERQKEAKQIREQSKNMTNINTSSKNISKSDDLEL